MLPRWTHAGPTRDPRGAVADDVIRPSSFVPIIPRVSGVSGAHRTTPLPGPWSHAPSHWSPRRAGFRPLGVRDLVPVWFQRRVTDRDATARGVIPVTQFRGWIRRLAGCCVGPGL